MPLRLHLGLWFLWVLFLIGVGQERKTAPWILVTGHRNPMTTIWLIQPISTFLSAGLVFFSRLSLKWQVSQLLRAGEDNQTTFQVHDQRKLWILCHQNCGDSKNNMGGQTHQGKPQELKAKKGIKDVFYTPERGGTRSIEVRKKQTFMVRITKLSVSRRKYCHHAFFFFLIPWVQIICTVEGLIRIVNMKKLLKIAL